MSTATAKIPNLDKHAIWAIALPAMITNVATAMIGVGDMWIVGRLGDAPTQGAVDVGARLFAVLFTGMNFLKTGTTGLVAQEGARAGAEPQVMVLVRGLYVGAIIAAILLLAKPFLLPFALDALGAEARVRDAAAIYTEIRYWAAPGVMFNLALIGFLVGRRQMTAILVFEVAYNLLNVGLGLFFVLKLNWGIAGIGWSSFIAEYAKLIAVAAFVFRGPVIAHLLKCLSKLPFDWNGLKPFLSMNRDLFLRTMVLTISLAALTRLGAERGPVVLAANGIIYQCFIFSALLLDGFENAAQVLNGERLGARDRDGFSGYVRAILLRGIGAAAIVSLMFLLFAEPIVASFAATDAVAAEAAAMKIWLVLIPFAGVASFIFDGVYVGASWTRALLLTMIGATVAYCLSLWLTWPLGNHGLWLSFTLYLAMRAVLQMVLLPRQMARTFPQD